jgi:IS66 Orf2 like protein
MTLLPQGLKVHLALGYTDMRKGIDGLTMLVQGVLRQDHVHGPAAALDRRIERVAQRFDESLVGSWII